MKKRPICLIDSGVGGFFILSMLQKKYPLEDFVYILDNTHFPYGNKTEEELELVLQENLRLANEQDAKLIVLACNTLSALFMQKEREDQNVVAIIEPTISYMNQNYEGKDILLLATPFTIDASVYQKSLKSNHLYSVACATFAKIVEEEQLKTPKSFKETAKVLKSYTKKNVDVILAACTHFGFLQTELQELFPNAAFVTNSLAVSEVIAEKLGNDLYDKKSSKTKFITSLSKAEIKQKCDYFAIKYTK